MRFDSITHTAEAEYVTAKTSVWWDIENCPVPKGWDAHSIAQKLNSALVNLNYRGPLTITAYGNTELIPKPVQQALSSAGISLNHVPSGKKDASDKKILVDMFLWVLENPAPANLMLISGDGDFSYALNRLRMLRYNILLAHPLQASPFLVASARTSWMWRSLIATGSHSSRSCCSFGSEHALSTQAMDSGCVFNNADKLKGIYVQKAPSQQETRRKKLQKELRVCNVACKSTDIFTTAREQAAELKQNLELLGEPGNIASASSGCHEQDTEIMMVEMKKQTDASFLIFDALIDAKNIEACVQDNYSQSRDAFMKCLEKQNKELMETIATSERSGREFWHDFKERLDKSGVAPLSVDHVFSELSRDFHVPKEVRECFEAIFKKLESTQNDIEIEKLEDMTKKKKSTVIEYKYEPYVCNICNVVCDHPAVFESHHKGRKHAAKIKKQADALLDNKQIQDEVIQDNGLTKELQIKPVKAPENMDYLDDQRQELREGCDEEKFQTIEEVGESDYKSLPNAECLFTELNPELSPSKESRECLDAIFKKPEVSEDANLSRELESIPSQNLEMNSGDSESSSAGGATEHPEEYMDMKKEKVAKSSVSTKPITKEPKVLQLVWCQICRISCESKVAYANHICGKIHQQKRERMSERDAMLSKENAERLKKVLSKSQTTMVKEQTEKAFVDSLRTRQELRQRAVEHPLGKADATEEQTLVKTEDHGFQGAQEDKEEVKEINSISENLTRAFIGMNQESSVPKESRGCLDVIPQRVKAPADVNVTEKLEDESKHKPQTTPQEPLKEFAGLKEHLGVAAKRGEAKFQVDNFWTRLWGKKELEKLY
ncbi:PREDICTED: uncharacterized protein LOC106305328 isoform X1 [Brassica oleracea var. oleracea]|uniref:uncharacterized protein LOC106305328 isoform X1 n=1 Tax=Brassica oleracea var. oleracea TaxID=109376 RepID=UPI0006A6C237|nr:PREDICTED: uncharacterized protein LOC106305328 isoform X1 [Brassica oleracea var. oleracea]